ncbi:MAG: hypothetical protein ABR521_04195 [Gaiellaceae bacterium]
MAARKRPRDKQPLPPPLPPERRTVGQLVAETLRFYGSHFWASLLLGVGPATFILVAAELTRGQSLIFLLTAGAAIYTGSYVGAAALVSTRPVERGPLAVAFGVGFLVYLPVPFLALAFLLPALAWLAFLGLAVPAAVIEKLTPRRAFARGIALARADFVHALGSLAALAIVAGLSQWVLFFLLRGTGESTARVASFLANLVISPVLFLGGALLYYDQAARADAK